MRSALILSLLSFSLLHGHGDESRSAPLLPLDREPIEDVSWVQGEVIFMNDQRRDKRDDKMSRMSRIQLTSGDREMEIRLELVEPLKPTTLIVREGNSGYEVQLEPNQCHWKGHVQGGGQAALSSCVYPDAFSGVVLTPEGMWLIQPDLNSIEADNNKRLRGRSKRRSHKRGRRIPHLVLPPKSTAPQIKSYSHFSDVVHVPLKELEEAARLAASEAVERQVARETASFPLSYSDNGYSYFGDEEDDSDYYSGGNSFGYTYGGTYNPYQGGGRRGLWVGMNALLARKSRAPVDKKKWVEMALFTDESMYKRMEAKYPNDTLVKLKDYATTMINTMDLLYGDKSLGVDLGFRLVHVEVMKKTPKDLDTNGGKAKAYLSSFCEYAGNQNINSGLWDHALLLTGIDLHEQGLKSTAGLAWAGTMCYRYYSCSVAEGYSFGSAFIITHEMGHSLGMEHDGVGVSETCNRDKFIMSPTTGPGKVNWSNCSGKNLQDFMEYGTSELRAKKYQANLLSKPTCLSELVAKGKTTTSPKLPGETYDAYFQCGLGLGSQFKPFFQRNKAPFNNICWILYCGNGTHAVSTHPALEGTKCDKDKYCRGGECVVRVRPTVLKTASVTTGRP